MLIHAVMYILSLSLTLFRERSEFPIGSMTRRMKTFRETFQFMSNFSRQGRRLLWHIKYIKNAIKTVNWTEYYMVLYSNNTYLYVRTIYGMYTQYTYKAPAPQSRRRPDRCFSWWWGRKQRRMRPCSAVGSVSDSHNSRI